MKKLSLFFWLVLSATAATAQVKVEQPWTRSTAPNAQNGAVFMTLVNPAGGAADSLVSAESKAAKVVELHNHIMDGNVMRMRKVDAIEIVAGATVKLEPMGFHVMLLGLNGQLKEGEAIDLTLVFAKAGRMAIKAPVMKAGATMPGAGMGQGGHQHMQGMQGGHQHMQHMQGTPSAPSAPPAGSHQHGPQTPPAKTN